VGGAGSEFTTLKLEEREMKLLLTGECHEIRRHHQMEQPDDLEVLQEIEEQEETDTGQVYRCQPARIFLDVEFV